MRQDFNKNKKVKVAMIELGVTHSDLAEYLGLQQSTVSAALKHFEFSRAEQTDLVELMKEKKGE